MKKANEKMEDTNLDKNQLVSVRFRTTTRNLALPADFDQQLAALIEIEFNKASLNPNFDGIHFAAHKTRFLRAQLLKKLGIKHHKYMAGNTYLMSREDAELHMNKTYKSYFADQGQGQFDIRHHTDAEKDVLFPERPIAEIIKKKNASNSLSA